VTVTHRAAELAVEQLYAASYARLVGVTTLAAGSRAEAEDAVQEAFLRLLRRWDQVATYDDPEAWVRAVAFRLLSNRARKVRNGIRAVARLPGPRDHTAPDADRVDVLRALAALSLQQRQVVVLHYLVGLSVQEISTALSLPVGTVKSRLSRSRDALAPLLTEDISHA
jgi:RNA polymerase sigma-70 factor (ECF subfamily)